jgi:hypothetical protein
VRTLLDEEFSPITKRIGFLKLPLEAAAAAMIDWRRRLTGYAASTALCGALPELFPALEPLTAAVAPRELLVAAGEWTALFDCGFRGTDPVSPVGYFTETLSTWGLIASSCPHTYSPSRKGGRMGQVSFKLCGPELIDYSTAVRIVGVTYDSSRWVFQSYGELQPFEEPAAYEARRVRERFTSEMLERYCQAIGVDVFNPDFYGPEAVLVESDQPLPPQGFAVSLAVAQESLGIVPGAAVDLPG